MGPNEQNQHFAEFRQNAYSYIHAVVLRRGLPSLINKNKPFVGKKRNNRLAQPGQTDYILCSWVIMGAHRISVHICNSSN